MMSVADDEDAVLAGSKRWAVRSKMTSQTEVRCTGSATDVATWTGCWNACNRVSPGATDFRFWL